MRYVRGLAHPVNANGRAHCIQMMNECAAAAETARKPMDAVRMKLRLLALAEYASSKGWLPECFSIKDELQP